MRDPRHIKIGDLVARINRALPDGSRLAAHRYSPGHDALWNVWGQDGSLVRGPMAQDELIAYALECGALRQWEAQRVLVNARGEVVTATVFAPLADRVETGL